MPPPDASSAMAEDVDSSPPLTQLPLISESPSSSSPALAVRRRLVFKRPRQPEFEPPPARAEADEDPVGFSGDSSSEEEEDVGLLWARLEARRDDTRVPYYKVRYKVKLWARRQAEMPREERMADFDDKVYATITGPWRRYCPARRGALGTRDVEHARLEHRQGGRDPDGPVAGRKREGDAKPRPPVQPPGLDRRPRDVGACPSCRTAAESGILYFWSLKATSGSSRRRAVARPFWSPWPDRTPELQRSATGTSSRWGRGRRIRC